MAFLANTISLPQLNCSEWSEWSAGWRNDRLYLLIFSVGKRDFCHIQSVILEPCIDKISVNSNQLMHIFIKKTH